MNTEEWIDKYYGNELTINQLKEFEQLLLTDVALREEFEFHNNLQVSIKSREKDILKSKLQQYEQNKTTNQTSGWKKWLVAASILILVGAVGISYFNSSKTNFDNLYAQNYEIYPNTEFNITRGANDTSLEYKAFMAYESREYTQAIIHFSELKEKSSSKYLNFYLAQSYLANGDYETALTKFEKNIKDHEFFIGESHWFAALTALKFHKKDIAKKHLRYLVDTGGYKSSQAKELLKKLN